MRKIRQIKFVVAINFLSFSKRNCRIDCCCIFVCHRRSLLKTNLPLHRLCQTMNERRRKTRTRLSTLVLNSCTQKVEYTGTCPLQVCTFHDIIFAVGCPILGVLLDIGKTGQEVIISWSNQVWCLVDDHE